MLNVNTKLFNSAVETVKTAAATSDETKRITNLFNEAVRDGWNRETDWLWLATRVTLASQKEYCYTRALAINPHSDAAKQGLKKLRRK